MSEKKIFVSYSMLALGVTRLALPVAECLAGHEAAVIEVFGALLFLSAGAVLYATDAHKTVVSTSRALYKRTELGGIDALNYAVARFFTRLSEVMYKYPELKGIDALNSAVTRFFRRVSKVMYRYPELKGIDALNYFIADLTTSFCRYFRKTHTGVLSYNMLAVLIGMVLLIVLMFLFGGYIP